MAGDEAGEPHACSRLPAGEIVRQHYFWCWNYDPADDPGDSVRGCPHHDHGRPAPFVGNCCRGLAVCQPGTCDWPGNAVERCPWSDQLGLSATLVLRRVVDANRGPAALAAGCCARAAVVLVFPPRAADDRLRRWFRGRRLGVACLL